MCVTPQINKLKEYIQMYASKIWASADTVKKQVSIQDILYTCKDVLEIPERCKMYMGFFISQKEVDAIDLDRKSIV